MTRSVLLFLFIGGACVADDPPGPLPDPLPLRRVLIGPDRVPAELERAHNGVLVRMSRQEFEDRVQRAARASRHLKNPPRLIQAHYRATLRDSALVGTGQWRMVNPAPTAAILPLRPLNVALQKCRIQSGPAEPADAVVGYLDGLNLGLLVDGPGDRSVFFDWSARGEIGVGSLRFDLQLPAATAASLELDVPADRLIIADRASCLLSGPHPAEAHDRRIWRIDFPSRSNLELTLRPASGSSRLATSILAEVQSTHELGPGVCKSDFTFEVEAGESGMHELHLAFDAATRPYEIDVSGRKESWEIVQPSAANALPTLVVRLHQSFFGGAFVVRCLTPLRAEQRWNCPTMRLVGAIDRGETIQLRIHPDIQLDDWDLGSFGFTANNLDNGNRQVLTLLRREVAENGGRRGPSALIRPRQAHVRVSNAGTSSPTPEPPKPPPPTTALGQPGEPAIERAHLIVSLNPDGRVIHSFQFDATGLRSSTVWVRFPAHVEMIAARVEGHWVTNRLPASVAENAVIELPATAGPIQQRFELVYATRVPAWKVWTMIEACVPQTAVPPKIVSQSWCLPAEAIPVAARYQHVSGAAEHVVPFGPVDNGSNVWEAVSDQPLPARIALVHKDRITWIGIAVAACLTSLAWPVRRLSRAARVRVVVLWLIVGVIGVLCMPASLRPLLVWPTAAGAAVALGWYLSSTVSKRQPAVLLRAAATTTVTLACVVGLFAQAPSPTVATVYVVPGPTGQTVFAEPELLDRLDALTRRATSPVSQPVLMSARYDGKVDGPAADIRADFQIFNPSDDTRPLLLPLGGVQLRDALLDGAPVSLVHRRAIPPRLPETYALEINGRGLHRLSLRFAIEANSRGEERDLRWTIPELAQSVLALDVSGESHFVRAVAHWGHQRTQPLTATSAPGTRLEVALGRANKIHVRWRVDAGTSKAPQFGVREAYLWTIDPDASTLAAAWRHTVTTGAVKTLQVELPDEIEVRTVGVDKLSQDSADEVRPRLSDWSVVKHGGKRVLQLEFLWPVSTGFQVTAKFVARQPVGPRWVLPVPAPQGTTPADDAGPTAFLAYCTDRLTVDVAADQSGVVSADRQRFLDSWGRPLLVERGQHLYVYGFRRDGAPPVLPLSLKPLVKEQVLEED